MGVELYISALKNSKNLELTINQFGDASLECGWCSDEIQQGVNYMYNRLYIVESGTAELNTKTQSLTMRPGRFYLIPAGLHARIKCTTDVTKLYFHFNLFQFGRNDLFFGSDSVLEAKVSEQLIPQLRSYGKGGTVLDILTLKQSLYNLLADIINQYNMSKQHITSYSPLITNVIHYIQRNLSATLTLDGLAEQCCVSRSLLTRNFYKEVGTSIGKYIDDQLLITAQWQLQYTNMSINEISQMLGYTDSCYFSRRFKQLCGITPKKWRSDMGV